MYLANPCVRPELFVDACLLGLPRRPQSEEHQFVALVDFNVNLKRMTSSLQDHRNPQRAGAQRSDGGRLRGARALRLLTSLAT